jgi:hypothetical protein
VRWFVTDRTTGRVVVAQWPNWPLYLWAAATLLLLRWVASGALVVWAVMEIRSGASPFRRVLGVAVLVWQLVRLF